MNGLMDQEHGAISLIFKKLKFNLLSRSIKKDNKITQMASGTLIQLWNRMIDIGYDVRKNERDGQKEWQFYEQQYLQYWISGYKNGIDTKKEFIDLVNKIRYNHSTNDAKHRDVSLEIGGSLLENKEPGHFMVQHFRIPIMLDFKLPVYKIAQMAYNAGQARAVFECENAYSQSVKDFYCQNNLDKLDSYIENSLLGLPIITK